MTIVCETERLTIRWLSVDDAPFILELLNEPCWIENIGDKGVRTPEDARRYIESGPQAMYGRHGFGLYRVELKDDRTPVGICGLIRRDTLPDVDLGFAILAAHQRRGYAREASLGVLKVGRDEFGMKQVLAITSAQNVASQRLLLELGFCEAGSVLIQADGEALAMFRLEDLARALEGRV